MGEVAEVQYCWDPERIFFEFDLEEFKDLANSTRGLLDSVSQNTVNIKLLAFR